LGAAMTETAAKSRISVMRLMKDNIERILEMAENCKECYVDIQKSTEINESLTKDVAAEIGIIEKRGQDALDRMLGTDEKVDSEMV